MVKLITTDSYFDLFPILTDSLSSTASDLKVSNLVFCEAKVSLMAERFISDRLGGSFNTDVYSFGKFLRVKKPMENLLSKEGSAMAIKRILKSVSLKCFRTSAVNLAPSLYDLIIQLKSAKVTPDDVERASLGASGILKNKLEDIAVVYDAYERYIFENGLEDQSSVLSYLPSIIQDDNQIKNSNVYLVGYGGFTAQAREIVKALLKTAKNVTAIFTEGNNGQAFVNETTDFFINACLELGIPFTKTTKESNYTAQGRFIVDNAFGPIKKSSDEKDIFKVKTPTEEVDLMAETIKKIVLDGKCRYRDITVALNDVDKYSSLIKSAFDTLQIPYFIDTKRDVSNHPIITLITSYIDAHRKNLERSTIAGFYKNPLFCDQKSLTDKFENYSIKYNLNYDKINQPLAFETTSQDYIELEQLRENISAQFKTFSVRSMLDSLLVKEKLEEFSAKLKAIGEEEEAAVNEQVYNSVINILDQMQLILGQVKLSLIEYKSVFLSGVTALKVSIIPQYNDAVFVGGYKETALAKAKYLFMPGLTSDVPSVRQDVAVLSDNDLTELEQLKVLVEPKIKVINHRYRENTALALSAFSERLYPTYPAYGLDGSANEKSELFSMLKQTIKEEPYSKRNPYLTEKQGLKSFALDCSKFVDGAIMDFSEASSYYKVLGEDKLKGVLDRANKEIKERLDRVDRPLISGETSPTTIENYYKCPYQAFMSYSLRVKEREDGVVNALSIGNLMHDIFSIYANNLSSITDKDSSDRVFGVAKEKVLKREEYSRFLQSKETSATVNRVLKECGKYCFATFNSFKSSKLRVANTEVSFGSDANCKYPAIPLLDGEVKIKGKIDRIDQSDKYYRVIDYKTGGVDDSEKALFAGVKLQLFLYALAVEKVLDGAGGKDLAGLYYLPVFDKYEKKEDKGAPMAVGFTLSDKTALNEQDELFESAGVSSFMPVKLDKKGGVRGGLDKETLNAYLEYALKISEQAVKNLKQGVIIPSPYDGACEFCNLKGVCDTENSIERKLDKVTSDTIKNSVKGGVNNG